MNKYLPLCAAGLMAISSLAVADNYVDSQKTNSTIVDKAENHDVVIKTKIMTAYTLNSQLNPFDIKVRVAGNDVTLTGLVPGQGEKELAGEIAKGVEGVGRVINNIKVEKTVQRSHKPTFTQTVDDATTTAAVKSKLLMNSSTNGLDIHVKTVNGIVTLTGAVKSKTEKQLASKLAENTEGVTKVKNHLTIR